MNCYLVQQIFDKIAEKHEDNIALYFQEESITYKDLYLLSNQIAQSLKRKGVKRGDRVAIILPKSINYIKAILAILKADAIYVPIDFQAPPHRTKEIIDDCSPSLIIADKAGLNRIQNILPPKNDSFQFMVLSEEGKLISSRKIVGEDEINEQTTEKPNYSNIDKDIAYILYTSGSTGKPKGVMISHLNVYNYINWATDYFQIVENDNLLNTSYLHFDMSTFDIYCTLNAGASLTIVPEKLLMFPLRLLETVEKRNITLWKGSSSLLSYFVKIKALNGKRMKSLNKIIFSGEPLPTKYLIEWMKTYPSKEFYNAYGPTECTGISTCYRVEEIPLNSNVAIPIGKACANSEVFALREGETLAKVGEVAELYIKGSSLSQGYWNDREKTRESFVSNPVNNIYGEIIYKTGDLVKQLEDGNYVFIGRKDSQIKHMGYRVELGEIEYVLQGIENVKDAAVIAISGREGGDKEIIGFVEMEKESNAEEIQKYLGDRLPRYMMPARIEIVRQIARNENGKIDRKLLKDYYMEIVSTKTITTKKVGRNISLLGQSNRI